MSKAARKFFQFCTILCAAVAFSFTSEGQSLDVSIAFESESMPILRVQGRNIYSAASQKRKNLSFSRSPIGVEQSRERVFDVRLFDTAMQPISYKAFNENEVVADSGFDSWSYKINLAMPKNQRALAHVSWISKDTGILMLDDLLPQIAGKMNEASAKVNLQVPNGWRIVSPEKKASGASFEIANTEKFVFLIGKNIRTREIAVSEAALQLNLSGDWLFSDDEGVQMADEIFTEYRKIFGGVPFANSQISLVKFPSIAAPGDWEAETRGSNVTILSADMPFKKQSLQRLHEQLRHEIFHLWLPNGVNLSGNYDWFYEGFALYQSLKIGVRQNRIRFDDFLDTLSRAHNIDSMQTRRLSLIEASATRFNGSETQVYARGMVVAFLCDLAILEASGGKRSISDVFRSIFERHRFPNERVDGNTSVLAILREHAGTVPIIKNYIEGGSKIDLQGMIEIAGLENEAGNPLTNLRVKDNVNKRQKARLDDLGYNSWRNLPRKK